MKAFHLIIKGRVQGVFYRQSAREKAQSLGLSGWVRNLPNGDVEALASGNEEAVQTFIAWCWQGPPDAEVTEVGVVETTETITGGFTILSS